MRPDTIAPDIPSSAERTDLRTGRVTQIPTMQAGLPDRDRRARLIQHYDALAPAYSKLYEGSSRLAHFYNMRQVRVRQMLAGCEGGTLLEVGCGPAHMAGDVAGRKMRYLGVDMSPGMIRVCRERHRGLEGAGFAVGDARSLPVPDGFCDIVLSLGMLEYVTHEDEAVEEFARVLRTGGACILSGINRRSPYNVWERAVYRRITGWQPTGIVHEYHDERDYRRLLERHGLVVEDAVYFDFTLIPRPLDGYLATPVLAGSRALERYGRSWCRRLGNGFLVRATKAR